MAKQKASGSFMAKMGNKLKTAHDQHKNDETVISNFGDLPEGIENGIAQLVECKIGVYEKGDNKGEYFFYAAGIVVRPKEHAGTPIEGLRTSITEPLCETEGRTRESISDHLGWVYNELRKLGVDTANMDVENLEEELEALKEAAPYFRFRTWKGKPSKQYPNPRTNHTWLGLVDFKDDGDEPSEDVVEEEDEAPKKGTKEKPPVSKGSKTTKPPVEDDDEDTENQEEFSEFDDLLSLAKRADKGDTEAASKLTSAAKKSGMTSKEIDQADSWTKLVDVMNGSKGDDENDDEGDEEEDSETESEEEGDEAEEIVPKRGDVFKYAPKNKKTGKPGTPVSVEVVKVNNVTKKCDLNNLEDDTKYKDVPFSDLLPDEEE